MKRRDLFTIFPFAASAGWLAAQQPDIGGDIIKRVASRRLAVPDFEGQGVPQEVAAALNETIWNDLADSGIIELVAKTSYPLVAPKALADVKVAEWSGAPVIANLLGIGNVEGAGKDLRLHGWLLDTDFAEAQRGQLFDKRYYGDLNVAGARKVGHEYAAHILEQLGAISLAGSKIYFVSNRTGNKEIWSMDHDGQNQQQMTGHKSIVMSPAVSSDGRLVAYTAKNQLGWEIHVMDVFSGGKKTFINPPPATITSPEFAPDNKLWFSLENQLYMANRDGSNRKHISEVKAIEVSPRVNPRTGADVLFISGRTGVAQLYRMKADGTGVELLTDGTGEAAHPAWSPDGRKIAFTWTRGFAPGNYNVFVGDASGKNLLQLTRASGSNENVWWAPDGVHLVFSSTRGGKAQIYTMLANGTRVKQLTSNGENLQPAWAAKTE